MHFTISEQKLSHTGCILIAGLDKELTLEPGSGPSDAFLVGQVTTANSRLVFDLGQFPTIRRYTLCHRYEPFWMKPKAGSRLKDVPPETQFLLAELVNGHWLLCVPLLGEPFRFSLRGREDQHLELLAETGDPFTVGTGGLAAYLAYGEDPFEMMRQGAECVSKRLNWGRLRREKPLPEFVNTFGWCTWDAFYREVSAQKVRAGLQQFAMGGVAPKFLILDDGWQSVERQPTGEERLVAFKANAKFNGDLSLTVEMAKQEFGVETFLVWHTIVGYWGGVSGKDLHGYDVKDQMRHFGEGIMAHCPQFNELWWGNLVGFVSPEKIGQFFDEYHAYLASQGVDGVKVDSQALLEGISHGHGGRIRVTRAYRDTLEKSAEAHFNGRLINCMSNAQETWYGSVSSTLLRSSIDFFPAVSQSHGAHLYTNAQVGLWFGEFMHPDWDMFQSGHEWGAYHAAARAISGGPVYVSDKPGDHDFELLKKLVCTDGSILRCDGPATPTLDTLCIDPTSEDSLLKLWNRNGSSGILGVFNGWGSRGARLGATYKPSDIRGLKGERFVCYSHLRRKLDVRGLNDEQFIELGTREFELVTVVPLENGFAPVGLADKFNSAAALSNFRRASEISCDLSLKDQGEFLAYSENRPKSVRVNDTECEFQFESATRALIVRLTKPGTNDVFITW